MRQHLFLLRVSLIGRFLLFLRNLYPFGASADLISGCCRSFVGVLRLVSVNLYPCFLSNRGTDLKKCLKNAQPRRARDVPYLLTSVAVP